VKNGERADRLLREAREVAAEMKQALGHDSWNLATRRAQEALELTLKALLSEMGIDYPKTHDPAPVFIQAARARHIEVGAGILDAVAILSQELAGIRGPVFYQETVVTDAQARDWVQRVEQALEFADDLMRRLRTAR